MDLPVPSDNGHGSCVVRIDLLVENLCLCQMLNIKSDVTGNKTGGRSEVNKKPVYGQQLSVQDLFDGAKQHTHVDQRPVFSYGKGGIRTRMYHAVKLFFSQRT